MTSIETAIETVEAVDVGGETTVHRITCQRCAVRYPETNYHCCVCHRVFRGASNFERHQKAFTCYTDAALLKSGMVCLDGIWRGKPMPEEAKQRVRGAA